MHAAFEKGFQDELAKQAGWMGALGKFVGSVGAPIMESGGKSMMYNLGRAASRVGPAAGQFAAQYPRASKAMRWGAGQALQGVGFSAAMAPFQRRQQITQVQPSDEQYKSATKLGDAFGAALEKMGLNGKILGRIGPMLEGGAAKVIAGKVKSKAMAMGMPAKKTLWDHPLVKDLVGGAKWGLGFGAAQRVLTRNDEPEVRIG